MTGSYEKSGEWYVTRRYRQVAHERVIVCTHGSAIDNGGEKATGAASVYFGPGNSYNKTFTFGGQQTSNKAQLTAIYKALITVLDKTRFDYVEIRTNSEYAKRSLTEWYERWEENGWMHSNGGPVAHQDLMKEILRLKRKFEDVRFVKVTDERSSGDYDDWFRKACNMSVDRARHEYRREYGSRDSSPVYVVSLQLANTSL